MFRHKFKILTLVIIIFLAIYISYSNKQAVGRVLGEKTEKIPVIISDNGVETVYFASGRNLEDVLADLNIPLYPEDKVSVIPDPVFAVGTKIGIRRATVATVDNGGKIQVFRTWKETVEQLLKEKKIKLGKLDRLLPPLETILTPKIKIVIVRVTQKETTEILPIQYKTTYENDSGLYSGTSKVSQAGKNGEKEVLFKLTYENGKLVQKEATKEKILIASQTKIILKGTRKRVTVGCGGYNLMVEDAAARNGIDPNALCILMRKESNCNPYSDGGPYKGLFQYMPTFWAQASALAGYGGASIWDAKAQIYTTAWAWAHGYRSRWP